MNILIIGSKGFIGSHLIKFFSQDNCCVGVDVIESNEKNYICVTEAEDCYEKIFSDKTYDICINASGLANVSLSMKNPVLDFSLNTINVHKMLEAIRKQSPECKYILLSSAAVYGNPERNPISEEDLINPISPYGFDKYQAEVICSMYRKVYGLKTYVMRLFSIYGNGQKKQVIWDIVNKFVKDTEVVLFGTGKESRDFIHIEDLANVIELIALDKGTENYIYNVANGEEICISEIANIVKKCLKSDKKIVFSETNKIGDPINWKADITKLRNIGYEQTISIQDGIYSYVNWAIKEI